MNKITVQISSNSNLLTQSSPIEIRDGRLKLVKRLNSGQATELEDGLYEISAVLEDGQIHQRLVDLQGGRQEDITFNTKVEKQAVKTSLADLRSIFRLPAETRPKVKAPVFGSVLGGILGTAPKEKMPIELVDCQGAVMKKESVTGAGCNSWSFEPAAQIDAVPRSVFNINDRLVTISLPLNPKGYSPLSSCVVETVMNNAGMIEVRAWITSERAVASTMQNMLASGYMLHAARIADEAEELLRDKYQDPSGALLGALILHKIGQLEYRRNWVKNLAMDFDWLNDGKVLLALLMSREEAQQSEALSLALRASDRPMMFTESYSLLLDLLRRWPWPGRQDERQQALESLAMMTPYTNWDSIMFYQMNPDEE